MEKYSTCQIKLLVYMYFYKLHCVSWDNLWYCFNQIVVRKIKRALARINVRRGSWQAPIFLSIVIVQRWRLVEQHKHCWWTLTCFLHFWLRIEKCRKDLFNDIFKQTRFHLTRCLASAILSLISHLWWSPLVWAGLNALMFHLNTILDIIILSRRFDKRSYQTKHLSKFRTRVPCISMFTHH